MHLVRANLLAGVMISIIGCTQATSHSPTPIDASLTSIKLEAEREQSFVCIDDWRRAERRCGSNCTFYGEDGIDKYTACLGSGLQRHAE